MSSKSKKKEKEVEPVEVAEEAEYIVEEIVNKRIVAGKTEYYLKWKGFPE